MAPSVDVAVLVGEWRDELPAGLSTMVPAGLALGDVLRSLGWDEERIAVLAPEVRALEIVGVGVVRQR